MRKELYAKVMERYWGKIVDAKVPLGDVMFNHILRNLVSSLGSYGEFSKEYHKKHFMIRLQAIKSYLGLLEEFPDFKHDEVTLPEGHFPDLERQANYSTKEERRQIFGIENVGCHAHYVFLAKQRLKRKE